MELKHSAIQKDYDKYKTHMTTSITTALAYKQLHTDQSKSMIRSRIKHPELEAEGEAKLSALVEGFAK